MRTEIDLDGAAEPGIINEATAIALRNFQAEQDGLPASTSEKFRLFGGYTDMVGATGLGLVLAALFHIASGLGLILAVPLLAYVTFLIASRVNMRANPATASVVTVAFLLLAALTPPAILEQLNIWNSYDRLINGAVLGISTVAATALYWRRFRFPPTLAVAITGCSVVLIDEMTRAFRASAAYGDAVAPWAAAFALAVALATLLWAIWWDLTDIRRETERSQTAFWLHCSAGFLLTRALFSLLTGSEVMNGTLILTGLEFYHLPWLLLMVLFAAIVSLLLDRRSLLSGVLLPLIGIFGSGSAPLAVGMLLAGTGLLLFNWGWVRMRIALLAMLPKRLEAQLPRTNLRLQGQRPTRRRAPLWTSKPGKSL